MHRETGETDEIDEPKQIGRHSGRAASSEWRAERKPAILATAFHDQSDAIGVSWYLPILIYPWGRPQEASYVGHVAEAFEVQNGPF